MGARLRRDHRQRRPDEGRRLRGGRRAARGSCARAGVREGRRRRPTSSLIGDRLDRSWSRTTTATSGPTATQGGRTTEPGRGAGRHRRRRQRLPDGVALARDRAERRAQALAGGRPRLHRTRSPRATTGRMPGTSRRSTCAPARRSSGASAATGLGFNNNYAPITLGPDGTAYLGVLGGIVAWRDREPPPASVAGRAAHPRVALRVRCLRGRRARLTLTGAKWRA